VVAAAVQSAYLGGMLDIADGREVSIGSFFRPRNIGNVIIAGLIVGVITTVGFLLFVIPGLIASIMLMFTVVSLLDRNLAPIEAAADWTTPLYRSRPSRTVSTSARRNSEACSRPGW
jgi:uncharacterized membrane protein